MKRAVTSTLVALGVICGSALATTPSAVAAPQAPAGCAKTWNFASGVQVQIDNCPGNGKKSWAWIWTDGTNTSAELHGEFTLGEGAFTMTTPSNSSRSESFNSTIFRFYICIWYNVPAHYPPLPKYQCSGSVNV